MPQTAPIQKARHGNLNCIDRTLQREKCKEKNKKQAARKRREKRPKKKEEKDKTRRQPTKYAGLHNTEYAVEILSSSLSSFLAIRSLLPLPAALWSHALIVVCGYLAGDSQASEIVALSGIALWPSEYAILSGGISGDGKGGPGLREKTGENQKEEGREENKQGENRPSQKSQRAKRKAAMARRRKRRTRNHQKAQKAGSQQETALLICYASVLASHCCFLALFFSFCFHSSNRHNTDRLSRQNTTKVNKRRWGARDAVDIRRSTHELLLELASGCIEQVKPRSS